MEIKVITQDDREYIRTVAGFDFQAAIDCLNDTKDTGQFILIGNIIFQKYSIKSIEEIQPTNPA